MDKRVSIGVIAIILIVVGFVVFSRQRVPESPSSIIRMPTAAAGQTATPVTDMKASFAIFTRGTFRVFTAAMYHNRSEDVYIAADNPNIVRIKKAGTTWNGFFSSLPFTVTPDCLTTGTGETFCSGAGGELKFYVNGVRDANALSREINHGDTLLISFGSEPEETISLQFDKIPAVNE